MMNNQIIKQNFNLKCVVENAIKIPGVKVSRNEFLVKAFENEDVDMSRILADGPIEYGCTEEMITKIANKLILVRTSESSVISFAAGIPGGLAMAAAVPADVLQFFGVTLRVAQELAYLYGADDFWNKGELDNEKVRELLIMYCGVMFEAVGATEAVRLTTSNLYDGNLSEAVLQPILDETQNTVAIRMAKQLAAGGIVKFIPVLGGVLSGAVTFTSMKPMAASLMYTFNEAVFGYNDELMASDQENIQELAKVYEEAKATKEAEKAEEEAMNNPDAFEAIEKLAKLKECGAISDEEFAEKKKELLSRI